MGNTPTPSGDHPTTDIVFGLPIEVFALNLSLHLKFDDILSLRVVSRLFTKALTNLRKIKYHKTAEEIEEFDKAQIGSYVGQFLHYDPQLLQLKEDQTFHLVQLSQIELKGLSNLYEVLSQPQTDKWRSCWNGIRLIPEDGESRVVRVNDRLDFIQALLWLSKIAIQGTDPLTVLENPQLSYPTGYFEENPLYR